MKMTTEKIAALAGVSRGAVDKTIHGRPGVREEVRQKILRVIEETGYIPLGERQRREREPGAPKTVAVILPRLTNPYFVVLKRSMDDLCRAIPGLSLAYYPCDTTDIGGILAVLETLEARPVDAFLFRGVRSRRVRDRLNEMARPVIFFDSDVPGAERLCLVGEDCVKSGRIAASLLAKSIGGSGQVAVITGSADITSHRQRLEGFLEVMRTAYPDIEVVAQLYSQERSVIAYEQTGKLLSEQPGLAGVCNLAGCSGEIGQAILEQRRNRTVRLVCYSTASDVAALIRKGVVTFSISLRPREQGRIMIETINTYLTRGVRPASDFIKTPISIALDENIDSLTMDFGDP